jgi:hypothetical protein
MVSGMSNPYTGPRQTTLEPNDDVMFRFMHWWFERCTAGGIEICWRDPANGRWDLIKRFALDDINAAARFAADVNAIPGCSVFFRAATVQFTSLYTTDADVVQIPGAWGDADTPEAAQRTLHANPIPSAMIVTGRHPTLRLQAYYKLTEPILIGETARQLNRQVCSLMGGDRAVINPSSFMRMPGSIAWPWKPGREIEPTEWNTPNGGGNSFTQAALPPVEAEAGAAGLNGHPAATTELLSPIKGLIEQARRGEGWHACMLRASAMLVAKGVPNFVIEAMAEHVTLPGYTVEQTRIELQDMVSRAQRKGFGPGEPDDGKPDDGMMTDDEIANVLFGQPKEAPAAVRVLSEDDMETMQKPVWLIDERLAANSLCVLYGPWGSFESFMALHLPCAWPPAHRSMARRSPGQMCSTSPARA